MADHNVTKLIRQSSPVDTAKPYDATAVKGRTILITGGASGFGAAFTKHWASLGASMMVADINDAQGKVLVEDIRKTTGSHEHHYIHCDVTNWQSQVDLFRTARNLSPTGRIDTVVANAGITDNGPAFDHPQGLGVEEPPKPVWKAVDVDLMGVMYTTHLATFWLPRNPKPEKGAEAAADSHIVLLGSIASLLPLPGQIQYAIAKHGVLGLFRSLRATAFTNELRVNMLCPYFIDTPIIPVGGRVILAGGAMGKPEDVVDAGTRLIADKSIVGRALIIGPRVKVDGEWKLLPENAKGQEIAIWEAYAHDFEEVDNFTHRFVRMLNAVERARGWYGWAVDIIQAILYPLRRG